ncbi:MAG: hypothetical protein ACE5Q6_07905 [Dehalococcoidia bacterium]
MFLKQSTTITLRMGPALDKTDGVTEETGLSPTVEISKNNGAFAARNSATAITHDSDGWYAVELNATDTNTVGRLIAKFDDAATHLPVWHEFWVLEEDIYEALFASGAAAFDPNDRVDVGSWVGTAVTVGNGAPDVNIQSTDDIDLSATQKASVNSEADTALQDINLDHLMKVAVTGPDVVDDSALAKLASKSATADWDDFVNTTDSLQAIRDKETDIETDTQAIETDTQAIQSRLPAALAGGKMDSDMTAISGDTGAADNAEKFFDGTGFGAILQRTTIATLGSQTSFTLTAGSADNDAYNGCVIVIEDAATAAQKAVGIVSDYVGSTKTVTLQADPGIFTMAATDIVTILATLPDLSTVMKASVNAEADTALIDYDALVPADLPTNFSSMGIEADGHVHADLKEWLGSAPNALASGRVDASVGAMAAAVLTAASIATDAITAAKIARTPSDPASWPPRR